jgi:hypothetical protein
VCDEKSSRRISSGFLPHAVYRNFTDVSEVLADSVIRAMVTEAETTSETSENFYRTARRNNPEGSQLRIRRLENLRSHHEHLFAYWWQCVAMRDGDRARTGL